MGVLGQLTREHLDRLSVVEGAHPHHAAAVVPEPSQGQRYADRINPGFFWLVTKVNDDYVWLYMLDRDGEITESYLQWARNRWPTLVERHGLELVG